MMLSLLIILFNYFNLKEVKVNFVYKIILCESGFAAFFKFTYILVQPKRLAKVVCIASLIYVCLAAHVSKG